MNKKIIYHFLKNNSLKLKIFLFSLIVFSFAYSKDNYVFDADRIKKVFCEWELIEEDKDNPYFLKLANKKKDIYIDISSYAKNDTPEKAEKRFRKISLDDNFKYLKINKDTKKILGKSSNEYIFDGIKELVNKNDIFFDKVKMAIVVTNGNKNDYMETLKLVKEAVDPTEPIKKRKCLGKVKYYTIEEMFDIEKLEKEMKKISKTGDIKKEIRGKETSKMLISGYLYSVDGEKLDPRIIWIENNKNFSREVMSKRWKKYILEDYVETDLGNPNPEYVGEDEISEKYFGVPAQKYAVRVLEDVGLIQYRYVIPTDEYTLVIYNFMYNEKRKAAEKDYEKLLKIVYNSLKLK